MATMRRHIRGGNGESEESDGHTLLPSKEWALRTRGRIRRSDSDESENTEDKHH